MKNFLKNTIKSIPLINRKINSYRGKRIEDILKIIVTNNKPVFIDIGANKGQTIEKFLNLYKDAKIYSFEPTPCLFNALKQKYIKRTNISLSNIALSNKTGNAEFFESDFSPTNSLLEPNYSEYQKISDSLYNTLGSTTRKGKVACELFDNWYSNNLNNEPIDIFKTDTQGHDYEVLLGSEKSLSNIKYLIVELHFHEFYQGSTPFYKIFEYMYDNGFYIYNIFKSNNKNQIYESDIIFRNGKL